MFNFQQPPPSRPSAGEQVNTGPAKGQNLFLWSVQQPQAPGPRPRAMENVSPPRTLLLAPRLSFPSEAKRGAGPLILGLLLAMEEVAPAQHEMAA
jgi:hypothetical protein